MILFNKFSLKSKPNENKPSTNAQYDASHMRAQSPPKALLKLAESNMAKANPPVDPNKQIVDRLAKLYDTDQKC